MDSHDIETPRPRLERMSDFFTARLDGYEEHMLEGGDEGYRKFAELVPSDTRSILDLGCGTGLELDWIFKRLPHVSVVGIDLTQAMLDRLKQKQPDKDMKLICGNYFDFNFGESTFDTVISYYTLHHFSHDEKAGLYRRILKALNPVGIYIEADYVVTEQSQEDALYAENARLRREMNIPDGEFYHFDTPCTVENQIAMLRQAGFRSARIAYQIERFAMVVASK